MKKNVIVFALVCTALIAGCTKKSTVAEGDLGGGRYLTIFNANTQYDTYDLLREKGYRIEVPDIEMNTHGVSHPEVPHITQQFDKTLGKDVLVFHSHIAIDADPTNSNARDRQRTEMKADASSPEYLKGVRGEMQIIRWKFWLPADFGATSRFTHIHQLKAVDGPDNAAPTITITPRKHNDGTKTLQLVYRGPIHPDGRNSSNIFLAEVPLADFLGEWAQAEETIYYNRDNELPEYKIRITSVKNGKTLMEYEYKADEWTYNDPFQMIREGNTFVRPKWGIYRSILDGNNPIPDMKDEIMMLADIELEEVKRD